MQRGQASVELILLFAVSLLVLTVIFFFAQQQVVLTRQQTQLYLAEKAAHDLAEAADQVGSYGVGTTRLVGVTFPDNFLPANSKISGKAIIISVASGNSHSDIASISQSALSGSLPASGGFHQMRVERLPASAALACGSVECRSAATALACGSVECRSAATALACGSVECQAGCVCITEVNS